MLITIERRASCSMFARSCKHSINGCGIASNDGISTRGCRRKIFQVRSSSGVGSGAPVEDEFDASLDSQNTFGQVLAER